MIDLIDLTGGKKPQSFSSSGRTSSSSSSGRNVEIFDLAADSQDQESHSKPTNATANKRNIKELGNIIEIEDSQECCMEDMEGEEGPDLPPLQRSLSWRETLSTGTADDRATLELLLAEEQARDAELQNKRYKCGICLDDEVSIEDMITLTCDHRFCIDCFKGYCSNKIGEAQVSQKDLVCPETGCKDSLTIDELKGHLDSDILAKYERFMLQGFAEEQGLLFCPTSCGWFVDVDLSEANVGTWLG